MSEQLRKLATIYYGKSPNEVLEEDGLFPIVGTGGRYGQAKKAMFNGPAVVVPRKRSLANPQLLLEPFWPVDTTYAVVPEKGIDVRWLYYNLLNYDLRKLNEATGVPSISRDWLSRIRFFNPDKEQKIKVGEILQGVDDVIEKTQSLIAKYQQIKAGLMHDLFTRGVTADGKLRPPREQAPELYKETPIGWIPREWDTSVLKARAVLGTPHLRTGPFGSALKGEHWVEVGHPVITIGALGEGVFIESELLYVDDFDARRLREFQLKLGDVVFSRVADVGRSVVVREDQVGWIMSSNLMRISLDVKEVIPDLLQHQLSFDHRLKRQIRVKVNSSGRDVANSEILNQLLFVWSPYGEQLQVVARTDAINRQLQSEESKLEKLKKQKFGLMHDLLTGKVRMEIYRQEKTKLGDGHYGDTKNI